MVSGEKDFEVRKPTKWIKSRLFDKNGKYRNYDFVEFRNGYGDKRPYFICRFKHATPATCRNPKTFNFSNGLNVTVNEGDYYIFLGEIIETGNLGTAPLNLKL
tara:strand:+ start:189 stop:497 length:309 start_codon:yes stop_codon:yes gene_type:complete